VVGLAVAVGGRATKAPACYIAAVDDAETVRLVELLESLVADRGRLAALDGETRRRLLVAAGRLARPSPEDRRRLARAFRRKDRLERRAADERVLSETGIRMLRSAPVYATPPSLPSGPTEREPKRAASLVQPRKCYVCKAPFARVHHFYDSLCPPCAELNWQKRHQTADLHGRVALMTGGRVKIGYHAVIKLLRAGARVIVTTRFPRDAALRYGAEADHAGWIDRLEIHGLDLRHTPSVEAFAREVEGRFDRLDFVLHNACQTVRRPAGFYRHLLEAERAPATALPASVRGAVAGGMAVAETWAHDAPALSQVPLLPEDRLAGGSIFPAGQLDRDLQQVDLRDHNSWRMTLGDVPTVELLEVLLVNAVAPFVLNARLKPLMARTPGADKHIVNVSAMEGQFYREHKTDKHPHTNMAKAALNMMTRTSAADYVRDGIHMNSVDTGWVTDEDPAELAVRKTEIHGFHPPLDVVDGAARICAPIFDGIRTGDHVWGLFLKDYRPAPW
jgi:NAD(P)-dependent dehydrogenase (short-subunit alcohol dehydrogenase family)